jgi:PPK2 family polyphosphate:nucleotide phosphotransferase
MNAPPLRGRLLDGIRVTDGEGFRLKHCSTAEKGGLEKEEGRALGEAARSRLAELQDRLYAQGTASLLIVLQGMDAAGKDGTIAHVMAGINPQGVQVTSFKQPGPVDLEHGFLWRIHAAAPAAGRIAIFNRSHYEDVLVTRVHPEILAKGHLSKVRGDKVASDGFWKSRYSDIVAFERYLVNQGTVVLKFFLHISEQEQRERLVARLDDEEKHWKFSASDLAEREHWDEYQDAYEQAIRHTARGHAPWFVVPADHKWYARLVVTEAILGALEQIDPKPPAVTDEQRQAIAKARSALNR